VGGPRIRSQETPNVPTLQFVSLDRPHTRMLYDGLLVENVQASVLPLNYSRSSARMANRYSNAAMNLLKNPLWRAAEGDTNYHPSGTHLQGMFTV
jgi:hypothetical protein